MVEGIRFCGIRTLQFEDMMGFAEHVLGLRKEQQKDEFVSFFASNGDLLELYGPRFDGNQYFVTGPVPGFEVPDLEAASERANAHGLEQLCPIGGTPGDFQWVHFRMPDGNVFEFTKAPTAS